MVFQTVTSVSEPQQKLGVNVFWFFQKTLTKETNDTFVAVINM